VHGASPKVQVTSPQCRSLTPAQAGERCEQDKRSIPPVVYEVDPAVCHQSPQHLLSIGPAQVYLGAGSTLTVVREPDPVTPIGQLADVTDRATT
jgi:hypothetical protein